MKNKNILLIRKKLDKLDDKLLEIIKKRTKLVDQVIKNKRFKKDIIDKKRIKIILKNIKTKSKSPNKPSRSSVFFGSTKDDFGFVYGKLKYV